MSPATLIPLIILAVAAVVFYLIRRVRQKKSRLRELAHELGGETLKSGVTREGDLDGCRFYYEYYAGSKNRPSCFRVWLDSPSQGRFNIGPEKWLDRFFKQIGIAVEIQTGDAGFDRTFYVRTDHVAFTRNFLYAPDTREALKEIHRLGFGEIIHDGRTIEAKISPYGLPQMETLPDCNAVLRQLDELTRRMPSAATDKHYAGIPGWKLARNAIYAVNVTTAAAGLALLLAGMSFYPPLRGIEVFAGSLEFSLPVLLLSMVAMVYLLKGRSSSHTDILVNFAIAAIGIPLAGTGAVMSANGYLDVSEIRHHDAVVLGKRYSSSRNSTNYHVSLKSWRSDRLEEEIRIDRATYNKIHAGRTVLTIVTRAGYLGYEWIADYGIQR